MKILNNAFIARTGDVQDLPLLFTCKIIHSELLGIVHDAWHLRIRSSPRYLRRDGCPGINGGLEKQNDNENDDRISYFIRRLHLCSSRCKNGRIFGDALGVLNSI
jgi:hypothetical protein